MNDLNNMELALLKGFTKAALDSGVEESQIPNLFKLADISELLGSATRFMNSHGVPDKLRQSGASMDSHGMGGILDFIKGHPEASGAIAGGLGGSAVGAMTAGKGNRGKGALLGGAAGAGLGYGAGHLGSIYMNNQPHWSGLPKPSAARMPGYQAEAPNYTGADMSNNSSIDKHFDQGLAEDLDMSHAHNQAEGDSASRAAIIQKLMQEGQQPSEQSPEDVIKQINSGVLDLENAREQDHPYSQGSVPGVGSLMSPKPRSFQMGKPSPGMQQFDTSPLRYKH